MEEETLSIIALIVAVIAIIGCFGVYTMIPEADDNLVTWSAVSDVDDRVDSIQLRVLELERNPQNDYDSVLDNIRDDIDDLEDDVKDINSIDLFDLSNNDYECLIDAVNESQSRSEFRDCLRD